MGSDMKKCLLVLLSVLVIGLSLPVAAAEDCMADPNDWPLDKLERCTKELEHLNALSKAATAPLEAEVKRLDAQIKSIQSQIKRAEVREKDLEKSIEERESELADQYVLLARKMREHYKKVRSGSTLALILSKTGTGEISRELQYQEEAAEQDRTLILGLAEEIVGLEKDKKTSEENRVRLATLQISIDKQAEFFEKEIANAKNYQSSLTGKIAVLSAIQESILSGKGETFQTTVGDVPLVGDPNSLPNYNPGFSPAFAAFSFGAPHFKGMSQYGAFGRAKAGQGVEDILRAYYGGGIEIKKDYSTGINITVRGYGTVDIETYTKRIYEMPGEWGDQGGMEALKAQAVAARSYALAYTDNGSGSICATEACQVYKGNNKGGKWEEAVNATRGWVMIANGKPLSAWYASTSGGYQESYTSNGYATPGFWDADGGRGGWTSNAWENKAGSPWFYKGWYKDRSGVSCGRSHPWLTSEEMADVLNAYVVLFQGGGDSSRVVPVDLSSCWGKGGNPYSLSELREIGGYTSVSGIKQVDYSSNGFTERVILQTNKGEVSISGDQFKKSFNLRAPGRIALKSGLFNIERK